MLQEVEALLEKAMHPNPGLMHASYPQYPDIEESLSRAIEKRQQRQECPC